MLGLLFRKLRPPEFIRPRPCDTFGHGNLRPDPQGGLGNQTERGVRHNVTRIYKDSDDWKESTSFGRDDLPLTDYLSLHLAVPIPPQSVYTRSGPKHGFSQPRYSVNQAHGIFLTDHCFFIGRVCVGPLPPNASS